MISSMKPSLNNARKAFSLYWTKILHIQQVKTIAVKCVYNLFTFEIHFFTACMVLQLLS